MTEFQSEIRERVAAAKQSLDEARRTGDDYLVEVRTGELESLNRIANDHEVEVEPQADTVSPEA